MSAPYAEPNEESGHFNLGDVVWFNYPHLDTARPCPKGLECYEQLHHRTLPKDGTFVLVMEAKKRTVLILAFIAPRPPQPACYRLVKLRTLDKELDKELEAEAKGDELLLYMTRKGRYCYTCIDLINTFPTRLAGQLHRALDTFQIKQVLRAVRANMRTGPVLEQAPV